MAVSLGGCFHFDAPDTFDSVDPAGRMHAAGRAAATGDTTAEPELVEMLASDDPAERLVAIGTLERLTGERLGYDPAAGPALRRAAIERWRAWLAKRNPPVKEGTSGGATHPATVAPQGPSPSSGTRTDR
jgi:hypothetical protein